MTAIDAPVQCKVRITNARRAHRKTITFAGGLAILGGTLALVVHPWFAAVAAVGGLWLILAPESKACSG